MKRKKDDHVAHELRDHPVPPVKGAVNGQPEDVILWPDSRNSAGRTAGKEDTIIFDGWM